MKPCFDLKGQRFGRWQVLTQTDAPPHIMTHRTQAHWICKCDCGRLSVLRGSMLRAGRSKSCGCGTLTLKK